MHVVKRADSAYQQTVTKGEPVSLDRSVPSTVVLRPLQGRPVQQALEDLNRDVVDAFGVEHSFLTDVPRAGILSRTFCDVARVRDNHVGVVRDEHTLRDGLVRTGAYRKNAFNPYAQRSWIGGTQPIYGDFAINEGRVRHVHLEPEQACVVKLPNGRFSTLNDSFVAFCLDKPLEVGTRWYTGQRLGEACLLGSRFTELSVGQHGAGRYYRLGADTRAIVMEPGAKLAVYEPNEEFQVSPQAQVMTWPLLGERLDLQGLRTSLADGTQAFSCVGNAKVNDPAACLRRTGGAVGEFVRGEVQRTLDAHLTATFGHRLFEGSALASQHDSSQEARRLLERVETVAAAACLRAGITLDGLSIKPIWQAALGEAVETIRTREVTAMVGRATEAASEETHGHRQKEATRAVEIDGIEAKKVSNSERLRLLEKLIEGRHFDRVL